MIFTALIANSISAVLTSLLHVLVPGARLLQRQSTIQYSMRLQLTHNSLLALSRHERATTLAPVHSLESIPEMSGALASPALGSMQGSSCSTVTMADRSAGLETPEA